MQQYVVSLSVVVVGIASFVCILLTDLSQNHPISRLSRINTVAQRPTYQQTLRFNVYTFTVETPDTGAVRTASIKAWRGQLLLTSFLVRVDGAITKAEVADLDGNRFPELYVFSRSSGSGSFGRVYGWQFFSERKADITPVSWQLSAKTGYMGHDSLWLDQNMLCRQFPRYKPGDTNASPTGGIGMMRYQLKPVGQGYTLKEL